MRTPAALPSLSIFVRTTVLPTAVPTPAALIRLMPASASVYAFVDISTVVSPLAAIARPALPGVTRQGAGYPPHASIWPCGGYGRRPHEGAVTVGAVQIFTQGVVLFSHRFIAPLRPSVDGGDGFRLDPGSGVRVDVRVGVSLRPDPRTDPRRSLTPQVTASVSTCCLSCERPCMVSGLSPGTRFIGIDEEVRSGG